MGEIVHRGGCLCGEVRFEAEGRPGAVGYCHCRMCQRSSGAPAQVWAEFPAHRTRFTEGEPAIFASSAEGRRIFCPTCGSQLAFADADGVSINVCCLDAPEALPPEIHIWTESQLGWFQTTDQLPRWPRGQE